MKRVEYFDAHPITGEAGDIDEEMKSFVHFDSPLDSEEFTLCGLAWSDQPAQETKKKVNCPRCLHIVRACKKVRI